MSHHLTQCFYRTIRSYHINTSLSLLIGPLALSSGLEYILITSKAFSVFHLKASSKHPGQFQYFISKLLQNIQDNFRRPFDSLVVISSQSIFTIFRAFSIFSSYNIFPISKTLSIIKIFYSLQEHQTYCNWSSSNAIQKGFYKVACIVMDLPSEPSTPECNQQNQHAIPAPVPFLLAPPANPFAIAGSSCNIVPPANPLPNNQQDPFAIAGSSCNIDGPALTPGTVVANICAQLADGPQLASSSTALQHPVAVGRRAVRDLFDQAARVPAPPPLNNRWLQGRNVTPPLSELPLHIGRRAVTALQVQAAALPLQQAPFLNPQIIPALPILPLDHIPIPPIVPVPMDEDALPLPHIPEPAEPVPPPPGPPGPLPLGCIA
ncbi:hypothetical protein BU17DRAFT_69937 [Hysterangium stoloniferum]|nr:hypothetical protein BU17DRAFT_69937 [Hysterangium stoloniferum]